MLLECHPGVIPGSDSHASLRLRLAGGWPRDTRPMNAPPPSQTALAASLLLLLAAPLLVTGRVINFEAAGARAGAAEPTSVAVANAALLNHTLASLEAGDTLLVPNRTFVVMGGVVASGLHSVRVQLDGTLKWSGDTKAWPRRGKAPVVALTFQDTHNLTLTSSRGGVMDGNGAKWWGIPGVGYLERGKNRPPLLSVDTASEFVLEHWLLLNSPRFHFISSGLDGATIRHCNVSARRTREDAHGPVDLSAFNTDGFDVAGKNIHIHDCSVWNQDDTIAIKASSHGVTENVLVERVHASGVGLTIGSIGAAMVRNVTFRDVVMHHTNKGIYVKFRESGASGSITDILYENVLIQEPESWPIWIGPQ
jgi:hypothetical protein